MAAGVTRLRRSVLSVPGSSLRMMEKAAATAADEIMLDLEDAVAPAKKDEARGLIVAALRSLDYGSRAVAVRVNGAGSGLTYRDIVAVVEAAGDRLDCIVLPKVESYEEAWSAGHLLAQIEHSTGIHSRSGRPIGLEAQIESPRGLFAAAQIAQAPRVEALTFGPGDYAAALGMPQLTIGAIERDYPGDPWHFVSAWIVNAARAAGIQAIDGPYAAVSDVEGLRESASRSRALGYDGKWAIHPAQIAVLNEVYGIDQAGYDHAEDILEAYAAATDTAARGAVTFEGAMIDEATRKMAAVQALKGRALGLARSSGKPPVDLPGMG